MKEPEQKIILCNLCGNMCNAKRDALFDPIGLINCKVGGGYYSTPGNGEGCLDDNFVTYTFSLCEFCIDFLFSNAKIPIKANDDLGLELNYIPAKERVFKDNWRKMKNHFYKELVQRNEDRNIKEK